ncbi:MAG TPA: hypothetical protein DEQ38_03415 [Elusimicrobia bacterium]|nr:MAG: hypothetical protein A2089_04770 [Elusimicrobia bacterium GWD2_63_28]HCC47152.1 hypothetical protein [Elusimicrobiota bacterium]
MKKKRLLAAVVLLIAPAVVFAGGTTASFLKLGSGARAAGLGGAFTAVAGDINAISYNPAGLANLKRSAAGFTRAELVEGVSYNFLGYSRPAAKGNIGLGVNYLGQSSIEGRGANREATGSFQASDTAINLAYARPVTSRSGLGLNFKYITSRIAGESANGWAVDAGWQYKTPVKGLGLGFAVQNLGPKMQFLDEGSALPLTARAGAGYMLLDNVLLSVDVSRQVNEKKTVFSFGSEYAVFDTLFMRAGYLAGAAAGVSGVADAGGFKAGFGFKLRGMALDYAVTPFGDIGKTHRLSLGAAF